MSLYAPLASLGVPVVVQASLLALLLLSAWGLVVRRQIQSAADQGLVPDEGITLRNVAEVLVDALAGLAKDIIGEEWRRFLPLCGSLFLFILISNLMGLVPGLGGATSYAETTWAWALIAFLVYNAVGIQKHGARYILQFCGPSFDVPVGGGRHIHFPVLFWFFFPLEVPLHFARMLTLSVRLLANMFADHLVVGLWVSLVPLLVPAIFMGLGTMVAIVQAFVFTLLTMTYIGMALDEPH